MEFCLTQCSGKCVAVGACAGTETKGSCRKLSQVCCVTGNDVGVKRKCKPTRKCSKLKGECRNRKCLPGEVKFKNKGKRVYCKGKKKCVCCSRSCENKSLCNLKGGYCQPTSLPCDGDLMTGKAFCKANKKLKGKKKNKCGCCVPKGK
ncbi:uncharacterized protein LOC122256188 [Penaeus japonicus]|uniref:uncharacterized protein LOC122256188 n=1 Tax=Penaeus japonicus TaxID=27405 RepID=UPI001C7165ED|nr:uncharacterized protein LOC122256188 [Penaeus japonicus]